MNAKNATIKSHPELEINQALPPSEDRHLYSSSVNPLKLAQLNLDLFESLCRMGTSPERVCQVLQLNTREFEEIRLLTDA